MPSLEKIVKAVGIDWTNTFINWSGGVALECDFDISPTDFLRFANQDFQNKDKRGIINAITNAKRAIDCQVDTLLACIGYSPNTKLPQNVMDYIKRHSLSDEHVDTSQKLKLIRTLEVAPSNLISKIRGIRNLLEHEYKLPTEAQANEALELATLFVGSVNNVLNTFVDGFYISSEEGIFEIINPRSWENVLSVIVHRGYFDIAGKAKHKEIQKVRISKTKKQYLELIRLNIAISIGGNVEDALYDLLQTINCNIPQNMVKVTLV